jgi:cyclophilin family peptidyl-prolyl cis-trans isomerase
MTVAGAVKSGSEFHITMTVRATMIATSESIRTGSNGVRMDANVVRRGVTIPSRPPRSAFQRAVARLALEWGCKESTAHDRLNNGHSVYGAVATANRVLIEHGCTEEVAVRMAVVDASLAGENIPAKDDAHHAHDIADAEEDVEQAAFRRNPCPETWERWRIKLHKELYRIQDLVSAFDAEYR